MKRKDSFIMKNIGEEKLLVPLGSQVIHLNGLITLNETAVYLWEMLEQECTENGLVTALTERFDVTPEQALVDVQDFLYETNKIGIVE